MVTKRGWVWVAMLSAVGASMSWAWAAEEKLPAFKSHVCTGDQAGTEVDLAAKAEGKLFVVVFVAADKFDRPIARYLRVLDEKLADGNKDATAAAVWLTDDKAASKEYLPKAQGSLKLNKTTWAVFEGQKAGPTGWNVDIASHVTAVIVRDGKELKRFSYGSTNETDVPELIEALKKAAP